MTVSNARFHGEGLGAARIHASAPPHPPPAESLAVFLRSAAPRCAPPFLGLPPAFELYRERGHRWLAAKTYATKCSTCIWGCEMPVERIIDYWNPLAPIGCPASTTDDATTRNNWHAGRDCSCRFAARRACALRAQGASPRPPGSKNRRTMRNNAYLQLLPCRRVQEPAQSCTQYGPTALYGPYAMAR